MHQSVLSEMDKYFQRSTKHHHIVVNEETMIGDVRDVRASLRSIPIAIFFHSLMLS